MWIVSDRFSQMGRIESLATPLVPVWHLKCALSFRPRINQWSISFYLMDHTPLWQRTHRLEKRANTHTHFRLLYQVNKLTSIWFPDLQGQADPRQRVWGWNWSPVCLHPAVYWHRVQQGTTTLWHMDTHTELKKCFHQLKHLKESPDAWAIGSM